jgi:hypothetical protein
VFGVTPHPQCKVTVTNVPQSSSGEPKIKLMAVMISEEQGKCCSPTLSYFALTNALSTCRRSLATCRLMAGGVLVPVLCGHQTMPLRLGERVVCCEYVGSLLAVGNAGG